MKLLFLVFGFALISLSSCLMFELPLKDQKCFTEDFGADTVISGTVSIQPVVPGRNIKVKITEGDNIVFESPSLNDRTNFAFTTHAEDSEYKFCFQEDGLGGWTDRKRIISMTYSEKRDDKGPQNVARKEQLAPAEEYLQKALVMATNLKQDFNHMKDREHEHRDTSESTNTRVVNMSILSICIVAGSFFFQAYYLRAYFKAKKLID